MISGTLKRTLGLSLLILSWPCLASTAGPDAASLVEGLKRTAPAQTAYTEVRFSSLFKRPMVAKGVLDYLGPGRLGKRVDTPYRETTTIADGEVTIQRGERKPRHVGLERVPELDGFLRGFSALLGGDATSLSRDFELAAHGTQAQWQLQLAPRDARLRKHIASIRVDGSGTAARCFSIIDADGDARVLLVESLADTHLPAELDSAVVQTLCQGGDAAQ